MATCRTPDKVHVIQVIEVRAIRGAGTDEDPVRDVMQYWSFDGLLLAERDNVSKEITVSLTWPGPPKVSGYPLGIK